MKRKNRKPDLFSYQENLRWILSDLRRIRNLVPSESSRSPSARHDDAARAIINARKQELLLYIQAICDDHLHWGNELLRQSDVSTEDNREVKE